MFVADELQEVHEVVGFHLVDIGLVGAVDGEQRVGNGSENAASFDDDVGDAEGGWIKDFLRLEADYMVAILASGDSGSSFGIGKIYYRRGV